MNIPKLNKSERDREYNLYNTVQREAVVKAFLFEGMHHRQIDSKILGLDSDYTHGFQSMGILHYLGLDRHFKGLFRDMSVSDAINELKSTKDSSYFDLITILEGHVIR
ncbi:hypothetical protein FYJ74_06420 [Pyramidobacter sp. SM-530-WT-4B]|uniref:Uncharacterized protein n=1 Tax=Pyramidobacter porci TaxID=2605789 RepID=A0A6L5YDJ9_9BACT|nr:hypothetical protein [Pyramidobacter porci]MST55667.1 hypothetical protein [Pyramidobacter porci]